ncbi:Aper1 [Anthophora quadrimaculata]
MVAACSAGTLRTACTYVPECPPTNNDTYTVHVPYKDDCTKFYKCNKQCGYLMQCPLIENTTEHLVFNSKLQVCDWPTGSDTCSGTTGTTTTTSSSNIPAPNPTPPISGSNCELLELCLKTQVKKMVHDTDCHKYYICMYGETIPASCEENKIFNPKTKTCDDPATTTCLVTGTDCFL